MIDIPIWSNFVWIQKNFCVDAEVTFLLKNENRTKQIVMQHHMSYASAQKCMLIFCWVFSTWKVFSLSITQNWTTCNVEWISIVAVFLKCIYFICVMWIVKTKTGLIDWLIESFIVGALKRKAFISELDS